MANLHSLLGSIFNATSFGRGCLLEVFALGYFVRPLGGMIFGHYGDTIGRKKTFIATILLTAIATFCVGLVPDYKTIGLFAPVILVLLRIVQGIALGGEAAGALSFVDEYMPDGEKTFGISFIPSAVCTGYLLASLVATILYVFFNYNQIYNYGWRAAFFLGGTLGLVVCILRGTMSDTPVFEDLLKNKQVLRYPLGRLLKENFRNCILGILIMLFTAYGIIFMFTLPDLLSTYMHYYSHEYVLKVNTFAIITLSVCTAIFGYILGRLKLNIFLFYGVMCLLIVALIFPLFIMLHTQNNIWLIIAYFIFAITISLIGGGAYHSIAKLFPPTVKYSGLGLVINVGTILGIGIIPLTATFLLKNTGSLYSIAYGLMVVTACPGIAGLILFFRPPDQERLKELDKKIRRLYNLIEDCSYISKDEEVILFKRLNELAAHVACSKKGFDNIKSYFIKQGENGGGDNYISVDSLYKLNYDQQQELYRQCSKLLQKEIDVPCYSISRYKDLLTSSKGDKYFLYFFSQLMILEYMAVKKKKPLTYEDINKVINKNLFPDRKVDNS